MPSSAEPFVRDCYFAPVPDEVTAHDLPVAGTLPPQLTGVYLRNDRNPRPGSDTSTAWRGLPERLGNWNSVWNRASRWAQRASVFSTGVANARILNLEER